MSTKTVRLVGTYYKEPDDVLPAGQWGIDFSNDMSTGEAVSTGTVTVYDADGTDVTSTLTEGSESISDNKVSVSFIAGTAGQDYIAAFQAVGDATTDVTYGIRIVVRTIIPS